MLRTLTAIGVTARATTTSAAKSDTTVEKINQNTTCQRTLVPSRLMKKRAIRSTRPQCTASTITNVGPTISMRAGGTKLVIITHGSIPINPKHTTGIAAVNMTGTPPTAQYVANQNISPKPA